MLPSYMFCGGSDFVGVPSYIFGDLFSFCLGCVNRALFLTLGHDLLAMKIEYDEWSQRSQDGRGFS